MNRRDLVKGIFAVSAVAAAAPAMRWSGAGGGAAADVSSLEGWLLSTGRSSLGSAFTFEMGSHIAQS